MYNFNILAGYNPDFLQKSKQVPLQLARKKYPRPSLDHLRKALNVSTSFLIVRHPLERLLSAYRDKIEFAIPNSYHYKLGSTIVNKYRNVVRIRLVLCLFPKNLILYQPMPLPVCNTSL